MDVTKQEVVAHLFAPLDGPTANRADRLVRDIWARCRDDLGMTEPVPRVGLPTAVPGEIPAARRGGSAAIAACEARDRRAQAVVRREHNVLNLSILLKAGSWLVLDAVLRRVLGGDTTPLIGHTVLYLGKVSAVDDAGGLRDQLPAAVQHDTWWYRGCRVGNGFGLWETSPMTDDRAERNMLLLAAADQDQALGEWVWSYDGRPLMPLFARYVMHMAKIRYQLRVWSEFPAVGSVRANVGPLSQAIAATTAMRHTVEIAEDNATKALAGAGPSPGGDDPVNDDRALTAWFVQQLDDSVEYLNTFYLAAQLRDGTVDRPTTEPPSVLGIGLRVLTIADEWFPARGGLSAFNRYLCVAMARAGAEVFCLLPHASEQERSDADVAGVRLIEAVESPGGTEYEALMRRPQLPGNTRPDVVIGHGRITGRAAQALVEDHYQDAARLHFVHMEPDEIEWHKLDREDDAGARAEERTRIEIQLARTATRAVSVGPRLAQWIERDLAVLPDQPPPVLHLDPGFDSTHADRTAPVGEPQILLMGRMGDIDAKGVDIAARAVGHARTICSTQEKWELLVRGAPTNEAAALRTRILEWAAADAVRVTVRPYTADFERIGEDVRRASLVLMPSRVEGFGLVGLEAIVAGVPALVSAESGLGLLLHEVLPRHHADRVVVPVTGRKRDDTTWWGARIAAVMQDRDAAFRNANEIQKVMADERPWSAAVAKIFDAVRAK